MNCKYPDIESYRNKFYELFPNSEVTILEFIGNKYIKAKNKYGIGICNKQYLLIYGNFSIRVAEDKTEYFINQAKEIHGNKYLYDKTIWKGSNTHIDIYCPIHKEYFSQAPTTHLDKSGCPKCGDLSTANKRRKPEELYIQQINKVHNNKYSIREGSYINTNIKIEHYCNEQKYWFLARPTHILDGHGCRKCANILNSKRISENPLGWTYTNWEKAGLRSKKFESFKVYIIECWNENEKFFKIGKTFTKVKRRFDYKVLMPYKWKILKIYEGNAREMSELENKLKSENKEHKYKPLISFRGLHECFDKIEKI